MDIEITCHLPLTDVQLRVLEDPALTEEVDRVIKREWNKHVMQTYWFGTPSSVQGQLKGLLEA